MTTPRPIDTAPRDGSKVTLVWTDADGQENQSLGQYRSPERLGATGGDWDEADGGWWVYVDGDTQKRVRPHGWLGRDDEEE